MKIYNRKKLSKERNKLMNKCMFCQTVIKDKYYSHKIGYFCSEEHFEKYCDRLSKEELALLMHSICPCSDEEA